MGIATKKLRDALLLIIESSEKHLAQIDSIRSRGAATLADADVWLESMDGDGQLFDDAQTADLECKKVLEAEESLAEQVLDGDYDKSLRVIILRGDSVEDLAAQISLEQGELLDKLDEHLKDKKAEANARIKGLQKLFKDLGFTKADLERNELLS